jgi:hypothetical protein
VLREGTIVGLANHTLLIARDGTERPIADSGAPIRDEQPGGASPLPGGTEEGGSQISGVVLVFRDQTEERAAQKALRESERKLREAEALGRIGNWEYDIRSGTSHWLSAGPGREGGDQAAAGVHVDDITARDVGRLAVGLPEGTPEKARAVGLGRGIGLTARGAGGSDRISRVYQAPEDIDPGATLHEQLCSVAHSGQPVNNTDRLESLSHEQDPREWHDPGV